MTTKTRSIKFDELDKKWLLIDATDVRLGQLATKCASLLIGKHKVTNADYLDAGDNVIIINAGKVELHPRKVTKKKYYTHSNYPGGLKMRTYAEVLEKDPKYIIKEAVWGMLPKNHMGKKLLGNMFIFAGAEHNMEAQQPTQISIK
jgi:large subunit ribosomal protein L13